MNETKKIRYRNTCSTLKGREIRILDNHLIKRINKLTFKVSQKFQVYIHNVGDLSTMHHTGTFIERIEKCLCFLKVCAVHQNNIPITYCIQFDLNLSRGSGDISMAPQVAVAHTLL